MFENGCLLFSEMTPEQIGHFTGKYVFWGLILVAGLLKCAKIARRPSTSTLCVLSLAFFLLCWLFSLLCQDSIETPLALLLYRGVVVALLLCSLVLGIVGLVDYRRHRDIYTQGKAQAIWGIVLSCCLLLVMASVVVREVRQRAGLGQGDIASSVSSEKGVIQRFQELNFRFKPKGNGWISMPPKSINPVATLAYLRKNPDTWFLVIAEKLGVENVFNQEGLLAIAKANLRSVATNVNILRQSEETINGIQGIRFEADALMNGRTGYYSSWIALHNGYSYQLITTTDQKGHNQISSIASEVCQGFRLIDPAAIAHAEGVQVIDKHRSPAWGYELDFSLEPDWTLVEEEQSEVPAADLNVAKRIDGHQVNLAMIPLKLPVTAANPKELLSSLVTSMFAFSEPKQLRRKAKLVNNRDVAGYEVAGQQRVDQEKYGYRMRMIKKEDHAYLLAGWWPAKCDDADWRIQRLFDKVKFFPPVEMPENLSDLRANAMGLALNDLGIVEYSAGNWTEAVEYCEAAFRYNHDVAILENIVNAHQSNGETEKALPLLEKYLPEFAQVFSLRNLQARLTAEQGDAQLALELYEKSFADGCADEDELLTFLNIAVDEQRFDAAINVIANFVEQHPSRRVSRWLGVMYGRKGEHDEAIRRLLVMVKEGGNDFEDLYALAGVYEEASRFTEAIAVSEDMLEQNLAETEVFLLKGRNEFELKWYAKAQESFQEVLRQEPGNEEAKQYLSYVAGLLGQGDRSQISTFVEPVPLPEQVSEMMKAAEQQEPLANESEYDSVNYYLVTGYSYQKDAHRRTTTHQKFKVHTAAAVDSSSTLSKSFDPLSERLYVNKLVVRNSQGELVAKGKSEDYYVLDDSDADQASQERRIHIPVPSLKPGYTVELIVTVESISPPDDFGYKRRYLVATDPMRLGIVFFAGDLSDVRHVASGVTSQAVDSSLHIWSVQQPTVYEWETQQAPLSKFLSVVRIADRDETWEEVGAEYFKRIESKLQSDDEIRSTAGKLTQGLPTLREKIMVLARHVQKECTYKAIEFGVRSQIPNTAALVRKNGYGDCKDHSVLLMQMLRSVGADAYLALVNSAGPLTEELPSLDQFNHMIVYVADAEGSGGELFIDATEKHTITLAPLASSLQEKRVLVLDPQKAYLKKTPGYGILAGQVQVDRVVEIAPHDKRERTGVVIEETVVLNPYCSSGMRSYLQSYSSRERRTAVRDLIAEVAKVRIRNFQVNNLNEPAKDLILHIKYEIPNAFHVLADGENVRQLVGTIPSIWEHYLLEIDFDDSRVTPFELTMPMSIRAKTVFRLPANHELLSANQLMVKEKSKFLQWTTLVNQEENAFVFEASVRRGVGYFSPDEFEQYYNDAQEAVAALRGPIKLGRDTATSNK